MSTPPEVWADSVLVTLKAILAPLAARIAVLEARRVSVEDGTLRDRLVAIETKASLPSDDLAAVRLGIAALERNLSDLRDRVVGLEHATPPGQAELATRMQAMEIAVELTRERAASLEGRLLTASQASAVSDLQREWATVRERLSVLETRAPVPGPPGADGQDGLGFEDLSADFDGDRTLRLEFVRGGARKTFPIALPFLRYQGVYMDGQSVHGRGCGDLGGIDLALSRGDNDEQAG